MPQHIATAMGEQKISYNVNPGIAYNVPALESKTQSARSIKDKKAAWAAANSESQPSLGGAEWGASGPQNSEVVEARPTQQTGKLIQGFHAHLWPGRTEENA